MQCLENLKSEKGLIFGMSMNFIYFLVFSIVVFTLSLAFYERFRTVTLYALAIGGAVNANFFHAGNYPIVCFGLPFGIDSIIYSLFTYCVIIMFLKENKREAYVLTFSSLIAIMFSASMQLVADVLSNGASLDTWRTFFSFFISAVASLIAICITLEILAKLKNKNKYLLLVVGMVLLATINSIIYYPLVTWINGVPENILDLLLTSFIGKMIALICSLGTMCLTTKIENVIEKINKKNTDNKMDKENKENSSKKA